MYTLKILSIILISVSAFLVLVFSLSGKKPLSTLLLNLFIGIVSLAIINLTAAYSGIYIPINWYSLLGCSVFGIPAIIGFLLLNIIFI